MSKTCPSELFPRLLAGKYVQIRHGKERIKSTAFASIDDQTYNIVLGGHKASDLLIKPFEVQYVEITQESEKEFVVSINYGFAVVPEEISILETSLENASGFKTEIEALKDYVLNINYNASLDNFLLIEYNEWIEKNKKMSRDHVSTFMKSISGQVSSKHIKNLLNREDVTLDKFKDIYKSLLNVQKSQMNEVFRQSLEGGDKKHGLMGFESLQSFLVKVQKEECDEDRIASLMALYRVRPNCARKSSILHYTTDDFMTFLYSPENDILAPSIKEIQWDNLNSPLSHYFINSSHNSFLTGNQLTSESSAEIYGKLLRQGLRCLEIDLWNGDDGNPIVTHGHTRCTKVQLSEVVKVIAANAFANNPLPVILSLEEHCDPIQQLKAAALFREAFGENLLLQPLEDANASSPHPTFLPSPNQLLRKIILKHKKLATPNESGGPCGSEASNKGKGFRVKIGDNGAWKRLIANVFNGFLRLFEVEDEVDSGLNSDTSVIDDLDESQLNKASFTQDVFLLRKKTSEEVESRSRILSFWHHKTGDVFHWPITFVEGSFKLLDVGFPTLSDLITFYQLNALPIPNPDPDGEDCKLPKKPLSQKDFFQLQEWYLPHLSEHQAIQTLKNCPNGTFLLRQENEEHFVLSFVMNQKVYHVNVARNEELDHLELGGVGISIKTIHDMIAHFKRQPFYNNVTLLKGPEHNQNNEDFHACETCTFTLLGEDLNLGKDILWESTHVSISIKKGVQIAFPPADGKTKYVALVTTEHEITFAYENQCERMQLDLMLGKLVSPIYGSIIQQNEDQRDNAKESTKSPSTKTELVKVSPAMSELVVYCVPRKFTPLMLGNIKKEGKKAPCYVMSSFNETTAKNWMTTPKYLDSQTFEQRLEQQKDFQVYHQRILSRIYPIGKRIDSSNYNPVDLWIAGAQMVSLNFQNPTKEIQINNGWFLRNGGCGYVLKPECLTTDGSGFNPYEHTLKAKSIHLTMSVLSGRHLYPGIKKGSNCNPFVRIEVFGCPIDCCYGVTKICAQNAFNPTWDETFNFGIVHIPSLSVVRVSVFDSRKKGNELMYQATLPVDYLRGGFRCIRMRNKFGVFENGLAAVLVYVKIDAKDEKRKHSTPSGSKDLSTMMAEFSNLEKRKNKMIQRSSILINDEEYEDIERQLKEFQDVISLELSQKKLATNSSIWERTNSQDSAAAFISIGGENVQVKEIKSEPFVPNFLSK